MNTESISTVGCEGTAGVSAGLGVAESSGTEVGIGTSVAGRVGAVDEAPQPRVKDTSAAMKMPGKIWKF